MTTIDFDDGGDCVEVATDPGEVSVIELPVYPRLIASIESVRTTASAVVRLMSDHQFSHEHEAVHAIDNTPTIEIIAAVYEVEYWRRWPEGREDDETRKANRPAPETQGDLSVIVQHGKQRVSKTESTTFAD